MSVRHDPRGELRFRSEFHFQWAVPPVELPHRHPHCCAVATCTQSHEKTKLVRSTPAVSPLLREPALLLPIAFASVQGLNGPPGMGVKGRWLRCSENPRNQTCEFAISQFHRWNSHCKIFRDCRTLQAIRQNIIDQQRELCMANLPAKGIP